MVVVVVVTVAVKVVHEMVGALRTIPKALEKYLEMSNVSGTFTAILDYFGLVVSQWASSSSVSWMMN